MNAIETHGGGGKKNVHYFPIILKCVFTYLVYVYFFFFLIIYVIDNAFYFMRAACVGQSFGRTIIFQSGTYFRC